MVKITVNQAYYLMFFALDYYFFNIHDVGDLGPLLGAMNPGKNIFLTPDSSDSAYFNDWKKLFNQDNEVDDNKAFQLMMSYFSFYSEKFELLPREVLDYFKEEGRNSAAWKDAIEKTETQLEEKYNKND